MTLDESIKIARQNLGVHGHMQEQIFDNPWPLRREIEAKLMADPRLKEPVDVRRACQLNPRLIKI